MRHSTYRIKLSSFNLLLHICVYFIILFLDILLVLYQEENRVHLKIFKKKKKNETKQSITKILHKILNNLLLYIFLFNFYELLA